MFTGGAPMHRDTSEYFISLGMPIITLYGMSETTGGITRTRSPNARHGSCGTSNSGMEVKICNPDKHGIGEVSVYFGKIVLINMQTNHLTKEISNRLLLNFCTGPIVYGYLSNGQ